MSTTDSQDSVPPRHRRWLRFSLAGLLFVVLCIAGVLGGARIAQQRPRLSPNPLQLTIPQRSTVEVPGLRGLVSITLGDITDDQVIVSVRDKDKVPLLPPVSVREREVVSFQLQRQSYYIRVSRLKNNLVGSDYGIFEISTQKPPP